jgi:hypothetical protein
MVSSSAGSTIRHDTLQTHPIVPSTGPRRVLPQKNLVAVQIAAGISKALPVWLLHGVASVAECASPARMCERYANPTWHARWWFRTFGRAWLTSVNGIQHSVQRVTAQRNIKQRAVNHNPHRSNAMSSYVLHLWFRTSGCA